MPISPGTEPPKPTERQYAGIINRVVDTAKTIITISDHLERLDKEDVRIQGQIIELTKLVFDLAKMNSELSGQMKNIEKRLEERDKLVAATIELEVLKATDRLRAEFRRDV